MMRVIKRIIIFLLSSMLFLADCLWGLLRRGIGVNSPPTCVVLFYHSIPLEQRKRFEKQMDTLLRYAKPVAVEGKFELSNGTRYAAVTFDDGFESVIRNALPILRSRRIYATVFVVAEYLGKTAGWHHFDTHSNGNERLMSAEELSTLPPDLISIGSHTMTHPILTSLNGHAAKAEICESRLKLQTILQRDITLFSFPYGVFNADVVAWCREAGYTRVFTILPTPALLHVEEYVTGRVSVEPTDWDLEFRLKLMGAYRWLPLAFAVKKYMIDDLGVLKRFSGQSSTSSAC